MSKWATTRGGEKIASVSEQLERIAEEMCKYYCKYPDVYGTSDEDFEKMATNHCDECPVQHLR